MRSWRASLMWGFGAAIAHRLALLVWMAVIWLMFGAPLYGSAEVHHKPELAPLDGSTLTQVTLAESGYEASDPGPTVFGDLTPLGIGSFDRILPGLTVSYGH